MRIIPKKTKYRLQFRNKIQSKKVLKYDHRMKYGSQCNLAFDSFDIAVQSRCLNGGVKQTFQASLSPLYRVGHLSSCGASAMTTYRNAWLPKVTNDINTSDINSTFCSELTVMDAVHFLPISHAYGNTLLFGKYGFAFQNHGKLRSKLIETLRLDIAKMLKKKAKVWLRLCCDTPVTARPIETRMGKGKGAISYYEAKVTPGMILFEFSGLTFDAAKAMHSTILKKSPFPLRLVH